MREKKLDEAGSAQGPLTRRTTHPAQENPMAPRSRPSDPNDIKDAQIIVVGGGLAGLVAAYAVSGAGHETIHLAPPAPPDHRTSALMTPSVRILQDLELLQDPAELGVPLEKIRLIDATKRLLRAPEALFDSAEIEEAAFGWNFANAALSAHFAPRVKKRKNLRQLDASATGLQQADGIWQITTSDDQRLSAPLIVGADGKKSFVRQNAGIAIRQHQHAQSALVCDLTLEIPLNGESVEYHYENGPFTLVPAGGHKANLVWVDDGSFLQEVSERPPAAILELLQEKSQGLFGRLALDTRTFVFPLSSHEAQTMGQNGIVLVGESGHAFPPIGAQGLNLSLRDVSDLIPSLKETQGQAADWASGVSRHYARKRTADIRRTNFMVDTLFKTLLSDLLPAQCMRAGGILALKTLPPLRKFAFQRGMGG